MTRGSLISFIPWFKRAFFRELIAPTVYAGATASATSAPIALIFARS
jgi:hypothetical protein